MMNAHRVIGSDRSVYERPVRFSLAQLVITLIPSRELAGMLWWIVLIWYLAASGQVLRHALEMAWYAGAAVSLLYLLFFWSVLQLLLGSPPPASAP